MSSGTGYSETQDCVTAETAGMVLKVGSRLVSSALVCTRINKKMRTTRRIGTAPLIKQEAWSDSSELGIPTTNAFWDKVSLDE
jgi:hypothetical protein